LCEKLAKISVYRAEALKLYGRNIADEMFQTDLDFLSSVLYLIDNPEPACSAGEENIGRA
jgi:hypothetical protein